MFWMIVGGVVGVVLLVAWVYDLRRRGRLRRIGLSDSQDSAAALYRGGPLPRGGSNTPYSP